MKKLKKEYSKQGDVVLFLSKNDQKEFSHGYVYVSDKFQMRFTKTRVYITDFRKEYVNGLIERMDDVFTIVVLHATN